MRIQQLNAKLEDLIIERNARLDVINANRRQIEGEMNAIKGLIHRLMIANTTWAERVKMIFKEEGVTVVSILTAFL